jgi:hypothetical protein
VFCHHFIRQIVPFDTNLHALFVCFYFEELIGKSRPLGSSIHNLPLFDVEGIFPG